MNSAIRDLPAWAISLVVNLSLLLAMQLVVREVQEQRELATIDSSMVDELKPEELVFNATSTDEIGNEGDGLSLSPSKSLATAVGKQDVPPEKKVEESIVPELKDFNVTPDMQFANDNAAAVEVRGATDTSAGGVEGTMDRLAYELQGSLKERKTLVIWLFDASESLNEKREAIAGRFENVYKQLDQLGAREGLHTAVASFGEKSNLMTPEPTTDAAVLAEAVRKIQVDKSGIENVFGTLDLVIEKFKFWHKHEGRWNKLVFIVTDERGDDAQTRLEDVISKAKKYGFRCFTVGSAAVFGQQKGYVKYVYPEDKMVDYLPVDQGPESAFPDVVQLPFWGVGEDWKVRQMSAAYGPYALTRLSTETGGMYLITDETRGHQFDRAVMRDYSPDYRPVRVIEQEIKSHPAKAALVQVAGETYVKQMPVPELEFRADNDNNLRIELTEAQKPVAETEYRLIQMFNGLSQAEKARDTLKEARWRAGFDLAMGRTLAMLSRLRGYNIMLANMKSSPKSFQKAGNNEWRLVPSDEIDSGPTIRKAADQARVYLKRVIDEHPDTPWAKMAERELSQDLGWSWKESIRYIPGMERPENLDEEQARLLLADEERQTARERQTSKPRTPPKL